MRIAWLGLAAILVCSCSHPAPAPGTAQAAPPPVTLIADLTLPSLAHGLDGAAAYAEGVRPGAAMIIRPQLERMIAEVARMDGLAGVDEQAPIHLLVVASTPGMVLPVVMLPVADLTALRAHMAPEQVLIDGGKVVLVGQEAAILEIKDYALEHLATAPVPARPTAHFYSAAILAARGEALARMGSDGPPATVATMALYREGLVALLQQSVGFDVVLVADAELATLELLVQPRAGSPLAQLVAAQTPMKDTTLLGKLPPQSSPPAIVMAGSLHLGPLAARVAAVYLRMVTSTLGDDPEVEAAFNQALQLVTGEIAMVGGYGPMHMSYLARVSDGPAAGRAMRTLAGKLLTGSPRVLDSMGVKTIIEGKLDAASHDGVTLTEYRSGLDPASTDPAVVMAQQSLWGGNLRTQFGVWDDVIGMVMGPDADRDAVALIDSSRKGPGYQPSPEYAALLATAGKRGDALVMLMNVPLVMDGFRPGLGSGARHALAVGVGGQGSQLHVRLSMSVAGTSELIDTFSHL